MLGLDTEEAGWTEDDGPKDELAARVKELLLEKADLLNDYFSINIDKRGNIKSLPVLLGTSTLINFQVCCSHILQKILFRCKEIKIFRFKLINITENEQKRNKEKGFLKNPRLMESILKFIRISNETT